jgi:hypothetical protein
LVAGLDDGARDQRTAKAPTITTQICSSFVNSSALVTGSWQVKCWQTYAAA